MEAPKRKYQKRKAESKISVRHYLNTKVKGKPGDGAIYYPLYVQITHRGKTNYAKSLLNAESTEEDFETFKVNRSQDLQEEVRFLADRVGMYSRELKENFSLKNIGNLSGTDEFVYYSIMDCLRSEIYDAVMLSDDEAIQSLIDEHTGQPLKGNPNDKQYIEKIASVSPLKDAIDWDQNPEEILAGVVRMIKGNPKLSELKHDFLKEIHFFDLLFADSIQNNSEVSLRSWQMGFAQSRLRRIYKGENEEMIVLEYISSIDRLLKRHKLIA